jgi:ABC-2 type transport system permease protein
MSATTAVYTAPSAIGLTAAGLIRSEWIKLRTVRSTIWSFAIVIVASVTLAIGLSSSASDVARTIEEQAAEALWVATFGVYIGQLVMAVLGVLVISGEYGTGMIRSTLTAVPKRTPALAAKAVVLFVASFIVGAIATFAASLISVPILAERGVDVQFDGAFISRLLLASLYLALTSVFALGIGTILRSSAGALSAVLGVVLLLPFLVFQLEFAKADWLRALPPYLFSNAGAGMYTGGVFEQWQFFLIVVAWTAVSLGLGALLLKRRDA